LGGGPTCLAVVNVFGWEVELF